MNNNEKLLYNMVLRQLRDEEYYDYTDDDAEAELDIELEESPFFGEGEIE